MKTSCEVRFGFVDVGASKSAHLSANRNQQSWADVVDINRIELPALPDVATLEPGFGWPLDGSKEWMPDTETSVPWGWWSKDLSGPDGRFSTPPELTITFSNDTGVPTTHSSTGITLFCPAAVPDELDIVWYKSSGEMIDSLTAHFDTSIKNGEHFIDHPVSNYSKVSITVKSMSAPYRYLRISCIRFGRLDVLTGATIISASTICDIDPTGLTLPASQADITFLSDRIDPLNPNGVQAMLQYRQSLDVYKYIDDTPDLIGRYYLTKANGTPADTAITMAAGQMASPGVVNITAVSIVGILGDIPYLGGIYYYAPLDAVIGSILDSEGIKWRMDGITATTVHGYLPIGTKRSALQQILFAISAVLIEKNGEIIIRNIDLLDQFQPKDVGPNRKIRGHKIRLSDNLVTEVTIIAHSYNLASEEKEIIKGNFPAGIHEIEFDQPTRTSKISGASFVSVYENGAVIDVPTSGEVIIRGHVYIDTQTIHTAKAEGIPAGAKAVVKRIKKATLVSPDIAPAVAARLLAYYQQRYIAEGSILPGMDNTGDHVRIINESKAVDGVCEQISTDLTGGGLETVRVVGKVVDV